MLLAHWGVLGQVTSMVFLSIAAALLLVNAAPAIGPVGAPPADPIAAAANGLIAQIEDDVNPGGDSMLVSITTANCQSVLVGTTRQWTIDWHKAQMVAPGDTFVFIDVPPVRLAIVGDASKPDAQSVSLGWWTNPLDG